MPQLYAPDFMKKLKLLIEHTDLESIAKIAVALGVKEATLRSWTKDHAVRPEGTISKHGREPVIGLFCMYLTKFSDHAVTELLEGPYDDMADAFKSQYQISLSEFIECEARFEGGKLILGESKSLLSARLKRLFRRRIKPSSGERDHDTWPKDSLVVTADTAPNYEPTEFIPLGREFRLEFGVAHRAKYFLGLQQSPQGWGAISASPSVKGEDVVHMPAPNNAQEPITMCEYHDHGPSRFTLIQSMQPFPEFIHSSLRDGIPLSRTDINFLARYMQGLPKNDRNLTAIDVAFIADWA